MEKYFPTFTGSEPQTVPDNVVMSPKPGAELTIVEPTSPNETPSVESLETDR